MAAPITFNTRASTRGARAVTIPGPPDPHGAYRDDLPRYGFTGHEMLAVVGYIHMNGRVYDPQIGRFLSADPHVQFVGNLQSYNRYAYVLNNPLSHTDPTGYFLKNMSPTLATIISVVLYFVPGCQTGWCSAAFMAAYAYANGATGSQIAFTAAVSYIGGKVGGWAGGVAGRAGATVLQQTMIQGAVAGAVSGGLGAMVTGGSIGRGILEGAATGAAMAGLMTLIQNSLTNRVAGDTRATSEGKQIRLAANGGTREEIDVVLGEGWEETLGSGNKKGIGRNNTDRNAWRGTREPGYTGDQLVEGLKDRVSVTGGLRGGVGVAGSLTASANTNYLSDTGAIELSPGGGEGIGLSGSLTVDFRVLDLGPPVHSPLVSTFEICGGAGVGLCGSATFLNGSVMSLTISGGVVGGVSVTNTLSHPIDFRIFPDP